MLCIVPCSQGSREAGRPSYLLGLLGCSGASRSSLFHKKGSLRLKTLAVWASLELPQWSNCLLKLFPWVSFNFNRVSNVYESDCWGCSSCWGAAQILSRVAWIQNPEQLLIALLSWRVHRLADKYHFRSKVDSWLGLKTGLGPHDNATSIEWPICQNTSFPWLSRDLQPEMNVTSDSLLNSSAHRSTNQPRVRETLLYLLTS